MLTAPVHHQLNQVNCSSCGAIVVNAEHVAGPRKPPAADDFAVCCHCGQLNVFTDRLRLRRPSPAEVRLYLQRKR